MYNGAVPVRESCDLTVERVKTGKYSHICEKVTGLKVMSDDFSSNGLCNLYVTPQPLLSLSYAMIFQVTIIEPSTSNCIIVVSANFRKEVHTLPR